MEKINSILTRKKCSKWLKTPHIKVFGCANSNGTGFEAVHSDVSQLWAICMHYTTPEENSQKISIFLHQLYFFLMGRSWTFLGG